MKMATLLQILDDFSASIPENGDLMTFRQGAPGSCCHLPGWHCSQLAAPTSGAKRPGGQISQAWAAGTGMRFTGFLMVKKIQKKNGRIVV